jgi:hypothetical protein
MTQYLVNFLSLFVGLRKTIAWFSLILIGIIFRVRGYIDGGQFVDLAKNTFLGFVAGNMSEHITSTVKEFLNSKGKTVDETVLSVEESNANQVKSSV